MTIKSRKKNKPGNIGVCANCLKPLERKDFPGGYNINCPHCVDTKWTCWDEENIVIPKKDI